MAEVRQYCFTSSVCGATGMGQTVLHAPSAMLIDGWADDVIFNVNSDGMIETVETGATAPVGSVRLAGPVLPGMANLHSHAFQRAMAGLGERAQTGTGDSFWSWRTTMYRFLERLGPEDIGAIASQLYLEMLKSGYTAVGEFHYLHHQPDGTPYDDPAEIAWRLIDAAQETGIAMTLLPVLYTFGGFGEMPAEPGQRRFVNTSDAFLRLLQTLEPLRDRGVRLGVAPHSLRAVSKAGLTEVLAYLDDSTPVHIHIAEQLLEVAQCLRWSKARPVAWLLDHLPVDRRWCLVHATHMTASERARMAASGAVAGLCPTTEANLGDGIFPLVAFLNRRGAFGIGSDSHVSISPIEELRWLEYVQRLRRRGRCVVSDPDVPHTGEALWRWAGAGGARALGQAITGLQAGAPADVIVLDPQHPSLVARRHGQLLDSVIFSGNTNPVRDVFVRGRQLIDCGRHANEDRIACEFAAVMGSLAG